MFTLSFEGGPGQSQLAGLQPLDHHLKEEILGQGGEIMEERLSG